MKKSEEKKLLVVYLNMVKWENKSIEMLRSVRDAYIKSHEEKK